MSLPKISVLMPVYNGEKYILYSIYSILCQSYKWLELLIYDDGSTDDTSKIITGYVKDPRVQIFRSEKNNGVAYARNFLLEKAQGEYIAHQDADDISYPDRLEILWKFLDSTDLVFTCCFNRILGSDKVFEFETNKIEAPAKQYNIEKIFAGNNCMYSRKVIDSGIRYDEELLYGEDVLFEAEIQAKFPFKMQALNSVLYLYRKHSDGLMVKMKKGEVKVTMKKVLERNRKIRNMLKPILKETVWAT